MSNEKRLKFFDEQLPTVEDLEFNNLGHRSEITRRFSDFYTWGILRDNSFPASVDIPVSSLNSAPNLRWRNRQFPVRLNVSSGQIDVAYGSDDTVDPAILSCAYDVNGNRVAITEDQAYNAVTAVAWGTQSSGNLAVPLLGTGVTYVWVRYSEVNEDVAVVAEDASVHYPQIDSGFIIELSATPVAPSGDGVSIFLAKITWAIGAGTLVLDPALTTATNVVDASSGSTIDFAPSVTGDPSRAYASVRDVNVEIFVDPTNPTTVYGPGLLASIREHINAFGSGTPTPKNPHATTKADEAGGLDEPVATDNQAASMADGIVDKNAAQNSPASLGAALQPVAVNSSPLTPIATLDTVATSAGVNSALQSAWVRIKDLNNAALSKAAYIAGVQNRRLYPSVRETSAPGTADASILPADTESGDGWIGFSTEAIGVYTLLAQNATTVGNGSTLVAGTQVLLLSKTFLASDLTAVGLEAAIATASVGKLVLGLCYWDGTSVFRNPTKPSVLESTNYPVVINDMRSLGLVGPQQISTEAKSNPNTGSMAAQLLDNQVVNSNYAIGAPTETSVGGGKAISAPGIAVTPGTDASIAAAPVGAITGYQWTSNAAAAGTLNSSIISHALKNLKPGRAYTLSLYYKASTTFNTRFCVGLSDGVGRVLVNPDFTNSLATLDGSTPSEPTDVTVFNDNQWHRAAFVFKTLPGVNPDPAVAKYLEFMFKSDVIASTAGQLSITNIQLTEGEWVTGYNGTGASGPGAAITNIPTVATNFGPANATVDLLTGPVVNFTANGGITQLALNVTGLFIIGPSGAGSVYDLLEGTLYLKVDGVTVDSRGVLSTQLNGPMTTEARSGFSLSVAAFLMLSAGTHTVEVQFAGGIYQYYGFSGVHYYVNASNLSIATLGA